MLKILNVSLIEQNRTQSVAKLHLFCNDFSNFSFRVLHYGRIMMRNLETILFKAMMTMVAAVVVCKRIECAPIHFEKSMRSSSEKWLERLHKCRLTIPNKKKKNEEK